MTHLRLLNQLLLLLLLLLLLGVKATWRVPTEVSASATHLPAASAASASEVLHTRPVNKGLDRSASLERR